jgi:pimeloyl-ACP methyl ester carboxylesterase
MSGVEWDPQIPLFSQHFRTIVPDQPGHGQSPMVAEQLRIGDIGRAVLALMDDLAIAKAHILGSSMGGAAALWLAVNAPQRVDKLVLFRVGYHKNPATHQGTSDMARPDYWRSVGLDKWLSRIHTPQGGADAWQQVIGRVMQALDPATSDHNHSEQTLRELTRPALIVAGDRDPLVPLDQLLEMYRNIPGAGLWLLPYTTHVAATNTWRSDNFALEVCRFLQGRGVIRS